MSTRHTPHLAWIVAAVLLGATGCGRRTTTAPSTGTPSTGTPSTTTPAPGATTPGRRSRAPGKPIGAAARIQNVDDICADVKASGGFASEDDSLADGVDDAAACPDADDAADAAKCAGRSKAASTDDEVAAILAAAHDANVREGDLAAGKAHEAAVRDYAKLMVAADTQAADDDRVVWSRFGIQPVESDQSRAIARDRDSDMTSLQRARGDAFDRAYIRSQILAQRRLLSTLDGLRSTNRSPDVACQIDKERALVAAHLTLACFVLDDIEHRAQHPGAQRAKGRGGAEHVGRARAARACEDGDDC